MAGALTISTLNNDTGVLATQNGMTGIAKAWVYFNGLGAATVNGSFNISSVTFVSTGNYTVNMTTAMPNANYCICACNSGSFGSNWGIINANITGAGATEVVPTTTSFALEIVQPSTARIDSKYVYAVVFSS
jgi:hypothetical protein